MTGADLIPTISSSLIKATELSLVEDAPGTRSILEKLNALLRYTRRGPGDVRFSEEWAAMMTLMELQRIQYPDRFSYIPVVSEPPPMDFVIRGYYLESLHREMRHAMEKSQGPWAWRIEVSQEQPLTVVITSGEGSGKKRVTLGGS